MQQLLDWTLKTIRSEESCFSWMEEYRYNWTPLVQSAVLKILDGQTILLVTDENNRWFSRYVLSKINSINSGKPLIPCSSLLSIYPNLSNITSPKDMEIIEDMLDISYPNGYFLWYIGKSNHKFAKIVFRNEENFMWVIDDEISNSFTLKGSDKLLDIKLIQLYKLFDMTIEASLFGKLELNK